MSCTLYSNNNNNIRSSNNNNVFEIELKKISDSDNDYDDDYVP